MLSAASAVSVTKLHSSTPCRQSLSRPSKGIPSPMRLKRREPCDHGCAAKPIPPASATARQIASASRPSWSTGSSSPNASRWLRRRGDTSTPASSSTSPYQPSSPRRLASSVSWSVSSTTSTFARLPARAICLTVPVPSE